MVHFFSKAAASVSASSMATLSSNPSSNIVKSSFSSESESESRSKSSAVALPYRTCIFRSRAGGRWCPDAVWRNSELTPRDAEADAVVAVGLSTANDAAANICDGDVRHGAFSG